MANLLGDLWAARRTQLGRGLRPARREAPPLRQAEPRPAARWATSRRSRTGPSVRGRASPARRSTDSLTQRKVRHEPPSIPRRSNGRHAPRSLAARRPPHRARTSTRLPHSRQPRLARRPRLRGVEGRAFNDTRELFRPVARPRQGKVVRDEVWTPPTTPPASLSASRLRRGHLRALHPHQPDAGHAARASAASIQARPQTRPARRPVALARRPRSSRAKPSPRRLLHNMHARPSRSTRSISRSATA